EVDDALDRAAFEIRIPAVAVIGVRPLGEVEGEVEVVGDAEFELRAELDAVGVCVSVEVAVVSGPLLDLPIALTHWVSVSYERKWPGIGGRNGGGHEDERKRR